MPSCVLILENELTYDPNARYIHYNNISQYNLSMCHEFIRRQMYKQRDISVLDLILLAEGPIFSSYAYF